MPKDYYKTLGVDKNATQEEIKKAFRKLAHQYHPDKATGDEAKFKEIGEAYAVLSDSEKRKKYEQFGSAAFDGSSGFSAGGFGQGFCDQRPAQSGGQKVFPFVDRAGLQGRQNVLFCESFPKVLDDDLLRPAGQRPGPDRPEILPLPHIRAEGDHAVSPFLEPADADRGVQSAGISQNHFFI